MGINYLLTLQNLRENVLGGQWNDIAVWISDFIVGFWPWAFVAIVYWSLDKKWGRLFLLNLSLGSLLNGFLKMTACVYRPWIKDARVIPAGDAITLATGYSFPSGHSTASVEFYGTTALWQRKKRPWISCLMLFLIALTLFSRNFLGVHTPQDVVVGFFATTAVLFINLRFLSWMEADLKKREWIAIAVIAGLAIFDFLYLNLKSYPLDYVNGILIVDPQKMKPDSYEGIGACIGFCIGWHADNHFIHFEKVKNKMLAVCLDAVCLVPLYFINTSLLGAVQGTIGRAAGKFLLWFTQFIYIMVIAPLLIKAVSKKKG